MLIDDSLGALSGAAPISESLTTPDGKVLKELARPALITNEQIRKYILSARWRMSKDNSHSYTLFEWLPESWPYFAAFVQHIRNHGYHAYFYGREYIAYDVDGMRYWTMGYPILGERPEDQTILINRAENVPGDPHRRLDYPLQQ